MPEKQIARRHDDGEMKTIGRKGYKLGNAYVGVQRGGGFIRAGAGRGVVRQQLGTISRSSREVLG